MDLFTEVTDPNIKIAFKEQFYDIFINNIYESKYVIVNSEDVVIDCGANMGIFSLYALSKGVKSITAYEPNRGIWPYLTQILSSSGVKILPYALSNISSQKEFIECYCPSASHFVFSDKQINKNSYYKDSYYVKTTCLDNECSKASFLKIDVEGAALEVLQGGKNLILNNKPKMAIACYHYPEEEQLLKSFIQSLRINYNFEQKNGVLFAW